MKLGEKEYEIGKLTARQQFHLFRKLAPIFSSIPPADGKRKPEHVLTAISQKMCDMKQEDVDFILTQCLSVVKRLEGKSWANVQAPGTDTLMFSDITLDHLFQLTMEVISENLGSFLALAPPPSSESVAPLV